MKCPHCNTGINFEAEASHVWADDVTGPDKTGYAVSSAHCPECEKLIVLLQRGRYSNYQTYESIDKVTSQEVLYPKFITRNVETEVPDRYKKDFLEACAVLPASAKASAAISRRILQNVLREEFKITHPNLAQEIEEFIQKKDIPSYLADAVDAVRNVGNFAAHPLKDTNTGEIVEVEPGEAEWLLDVNESLFDFTFVQPKRLEERRKNLNAKLTAMGKPPMKSK